MSFITHALVSKVYHFISLVIISVVLLFRTLTRVATSIPFYYYKNPMYTTFSVVELNPPLTSRRRRPVLFSLPPVVAVSFSPPVVKISQAPLTRSTQFTFTHAQFTHVQSNSREATHVHVQFQAHEEHPSSRPTPQPSVSAVPRTLFSTYLRRSLRYSHRPSHNTHLENLSIDSLTIRSFYSASSVIF